MRATVIVPIAALLLSLTPVVPLAAQAALLVVSGAAVAVLIGRDHGRVAALATMVAFASSAVVFVGGLPAARPAAGTLPTAGAFWWWPFTVAAIVTMRLSLGLRAPTREVGGWLTWFLCGAVAAHLFRNVVADIAEALTLAPLAALVGIAVASFTERQNRLWWQAPALVASLTATATWQAQIPLAAAMTARTLAPLLIASTLVLFFDALSDEETEAHSPTDTSTLPTLDGFDAHRART
jgi:hypothetical protein